MRHAAGLLAASLLLAASWPAPCRAQAVVQQADGRVNANRLDLAGMAPCRSTGQETLLSAICHNMVAPPGPQFSVNLGLTSSDGDGEKVTLYTGAHAMAGSGTMWARNALLQIDPGSSGGQADEIDLNLYGCDQGNAEGVGANCPANRFTPSIGLLVTGAPVRNTAQSGIEVTADGAGGAVTRALWHQGLNVAGDAVDFADIFESTRADYVLKSDGTHKFGIDLTAASFGGSAINFNLRNAGQTLTWRNGASADGYYSIYASPDDSGLNFVTGGTGAAKAMRLLHDGTVILPGNVSVAGAVVTTPHTPRSSSEACAPGQLATDSTYVYWCASPNHWLRAAGQSW